MNAILHISGSVHETLPIHTSNVLRQWQLDQVCLPGVELKDYQYETAFQIATLDLHI